MNVSDWGHSVHVHMCVHVCLCAKMHFIVYLKLIWGLCSLSLINQVGFFKLQTGKNTKGHWYIYIYKKKKHYIENAAEIVDKWMLWTLSPISSFCIVLGDNLLMAWKDRRSSYSHKKCYFNIQLWLLSSERHKNVNLTFNYTV